MNSPSTWTGFLPKHALVMARAARPTTEAATAATPAAPAAATESTFLSGRGNPATELVFISHSATESPSERQLLDKMIEAMGLSPDQVYVAGLSATQTDQTLEALQPKVFVALGEAATQSLLGHAAPRGRLQARGSAQVMPTFHPSDLLSHPASKRDAWADLQAVARAIGWTIPSRTKS